jgi:hypothetical protein
VKRISAKKISVISPEGEGRGEELREGWEE